MEWPSIPILFNLEAINLIEELGPKIGKLECVNAYLRKMYFEREKNTIVEFKNFYASYLGTYIAASLEEKRPYAEIDEFSVLQEIYTLLHERIKIIICHLDVYDPVKGMIEGYPLSIIQEVCQCDALDARVIGEAVKKLVVVRKIFPKWFPYGFNNEIIEEVPLTGDDESPLNDLELQALLHYLGVKEKNYVRILLKVAYEMSRQRNSSPQEDIKEAVLTLINAKWMYLLCLIGTF